MDEIPSVPCKSLPDVESLFSPLQGPSLDYGSIYLDKLLCMADQNDLSIRGNYDTSSGESLMVVFDRCDSEKRAKFGLKCKSDTEIDEWLRFKYIIVRENSRQFVQHKFQNERLDDSSRITWYPISAINRIDVVKMITRSEIQLNDGIA